MEKSIFDQFTRKYALSKTLRFELKPEGKKIYDERVKKEITLTEKFLLDNQVLEKDKTIDDSYHQAKFYFDALHQRFINSALASEHSGSLKFDKLAGFLEEKNKEVLFLRRKAGEARKEHNNAQILQDKIRGLEKEIENKKTEFYKDICILLDYQAEEWKRSYVGKKLEDGSEIKFGKKKDGEEKKNEKGVGFLTSAGVLQVLKYEFPESKEVEFQARKWPSLYVEEIESAGNKRYIFKSFSKFSGYLTKFQETRKNVYSDNGIATALATRIVSNFEIFIANRKTFKDKYLKNHQDIGFEHTDIFEVENYKKYLLQDGIEASETSSSYDKSYNKILGQLNKALKEYRDKRASEAKQQKDNSFKKSDYPLFKTLEKQILGKVEKERQLIEATETETKEEVFMKRFREFIEEGEWRFAIAKGFMTKFFADEFVSEYAGVYVKNSTINTISRRWLLDGYNFEKNLPQASKDKKEGDVVKVKKFVTLADVKEAVENLEGNPFKEDYYKKQIIYTAGQERWTQFLAVWKYEFENLFGDVEKENSDIVSGYESCRSEARRLISFSKERKPKEIAIVKSYADASLRIFQMMKYIVLDERDMGNLSGISTDFYAELDGYSKDFRFNKYYDAFRNFITKKPFDESKIKLNFEKGTLLKGWPESPKGNAQYFGYILRKDDDYFLAITKYSHFLDVEKHGLTPEKGEDSYEKVEYSSLDWGKNIVGGQVYTSFTKNRFGESISYQEHKKQFSLIEHLAFVKLLINEKYVAKFPVLQEFISKDYGSVLEMQQAFSALQLGGIRFEKIRADWVNDQICKEKKKTHQLYLFQILNRDLRARESASSKNTHTLYWDALFSNANLQERTFDLLGNAEIFYRKASEGLRVRKNNQGEDYANKKGEKIVEGRRYSRDIIQFHIPVLLNASKSPMKQGVFNKEVNHFLGGDEEFNVIGLDRGEKHLVYYSVINQNREIIDQGSLNTINGVNYFEKLVLREKERLENRQSWSPVAKIKDLKRGYVSQVVRKIADLVMQHNAIVVMEDLNMGFKQVRGGIERSVYQQLEKQLIDKFGYLVFKNKKPTEKGGALCGYQLSAPFGSFEKMGKQTGVIFYTQADYTSVTDPLTGFRKNLYISNSAPQKTIAEIIDKFETIGWDDEFQSYFFTYNPIDFAEEKYKKNIFSKKWTIYSKCPRIRREKDEKGYWQYQPIDVNAKFRELFVLWGFEHVEGDIWEQIQIKESDGGLTGERNFDGKQRSFYHAFIYLFNLILQLRNSYSEQWVTEEKDGKVVAKNIGENIDFIASPVEPFFSTFSVNKKDEELSPQNFGPFEEKVIGEKRGQIIEEFNGDANGAYNIARKGVIILGRIKNRLNLCIFKRDWDDATDKWWREVEG